MFDKVKYLTPVAVKMVTSTTMSLILGDAICVSLMKIKNFKLEDYKMIHPGGALGANMLQVEDIKHTGKKSF